MKSIYQLVPDLEELVKIKGGWFNESLQQSIGTDIGSRLALHFGKTRRPPALRLSKMGPSCPKALWASIHAPDEAESLPAWAEIKYAFGHILEALCISLAKAAGHEVTGEQDELVLDGIVGHRDAVIDGAVVDVKSCSSRAFQKFKTGSIAFDDSFGYLDQLDGYVVASASDPLVTVKDRGYILAIDKTLGHVCLFEHKIREKSIRQRIEKHKEIIKLEKPPSCECISIPDGKSGNECLDVKASYNNFKYFCNPNLRTFLYSNGPRFLIKVLRKPDVVEIDRYGKIIYS